MENRVNTNNLPTEVSVWTKIRNFLCQDIKLELTPKQEKVKNALFREIEITDNIKL